MGRIIRSIDPADPWSYVNEQDLRMGRTRMGRIIRSIDLADPCENMDVQDHPIRKSR